MKQSMATLVYRTSFFLAGALLMFFIEEYRIYVQDVPQGKAVQKERVIENLLSRSRPYSLTSSGNLEQLRASHQQHSHTWEAHPVYSFVAPGIKDRLSGITFNRWNNEQCTLCRFLQENVSNKNLLYGFEAKITDAKRNIMAANFCNTESGSSGYEKEDTQTYYIPDVFEYKTW